MTVIATMKRRRRQMKKNFRHIAKFGRPKFPKPSAEKSQRRLSQVIEKQKRIAANKGNKK